MVTILTLAAQHYIRLQEQGKSGVEAMQHTVQRFGVRPDEVREQVRTLRSLAVAA